MKTLTTVLKNFWLDEEGMEMVEYVAVGGALVIGAAATFGTLRTAIATEMALIIAAL
jgi:Flp pilus assembly pilin Flp